MNNSKFPDVIAYNNDHSHDSLISAAFVTIQKIQKDIIAIEFENGELSIVLPSFERMTAWEFDKLSQTRIVMLEIEKCFHDNFLSEFCYKPPKNF